VALRESGLVVGGIPYTMEDMQIRKLLGDSFEGAVGQPSRVTSASANAGQDPTAAHARSLTQILQAAYSVARTPGSEHRSLSSRHSYSNRTEMRLSV
jgi:hypothetical protein